VFENSNSENDTALMVQYTIPLGLPVCRKKSIGSIRGHLYDQETQNPVANAILMLNGTTAVTDKAGNFTFPSVRPGIYYLNVDTASIGMSRIPTRKTPIELAVQGGEKTSVDIPITLAARLSGRIMVYGYENNSDKMPAGRQPADTNELYVTANSSGNNTNAKLIEDHGLTNTIIELKSSSEIRRTVTDNQGNFEFEELRPGNWTLKIQPENLPDYQYIEQDTFDLQLKPGEKNQISTKVLPKKRRIRMLVEEQTVIEEKK
jgi:protocatechuate 3,4-dioxygenase beta subunit